jgi:antitoxin component YwqK of YwqJK toxin-antitoxin module
MRLKIFVSVSLLIISVSSFCQVNDGLNNTDKQGRKQGHWSKNYPNGSVMYDGIFKDDHPVGELKRFYEDGKIKSILVYSNDGKTAIARMYHTNGNISAKGTYKDQKREGQWKFYSAYLNGYLISEENYKANLKNGPAFKFYTDSTIAEKLNYVNDVKSGEWTQYYPDKKLHLRSYFHNGRLNGKFEVWFENGAIEYSGQYKDDSRDGDWVIFNKDGTVRYKLNYVLGVTQDRKMDIDESNLLDSLENNIGRVADPEKTGIIRQ